jgi:hypothetical protein
MRYYLAAAVGSTPTMGTMTPNENSNPKTCTSQVTACSYVHLPAKVQNCFRVFYENSQNYLNTSSCTMCVRRPIVCWRGNRDNNE